MRWFINTTAALLVAAYVGINTLAAQASNWSAATCYGRVGSEISWMDVFRRQGVFGRAYVTLAMSSQFPERWPMDEPTYQRLFGAPEGLRPNE